LRHSIGGAVYQFVFAFAIRVRAHVRSLIALLSVFSFVLQSICWVTWPDALGVGDPSRIYWIALVLSTLLAIGHSEPVRQDRDHRILSIVAAGGGDFSGVVSFFLTIFLGFWLVLFG